MYRSHRRGLAPSGTLIIAAIIAAFALVLSWHFVGDPQQEARQTTIDRVEVLIGALDQYAIDHGGVFPTTDEGLQILLKKPTDEHADARWNGPYVKAPEIFADAWQTPFQYVSPFAGNDPYHLWSCGADRAEGGEGADADIKSWDRTKLVP